MNIFRSMSAKGMIILVSSGIFLAALCAAQLSQGATTDKVYNLKYSSPFIAPELPSVFGNNMCDIAEKRSNGRIKIKRFTGGVLAGPLEHLQLVGAGGVDLGSILPAYYTKELVLNKLLNMPQFVDRQTAQANVDAMCWELADVMAKLDKEQSRNNIKILSWYTQGALSILAKKDIESLADLKGMKVNSMAVAENAIFKEYGMHPVNVKIPELYEALSRGVIDCIFMATSAMVTSKWYELATTNLDLGIVMQMTPVVVNRKLWNSLPGDIQTILREASRESSRFSIEHDKKMMKKFYKIMGDAGLKLRNLTQEDQGKYFDINMKYVYPQWLTECGAAGVQEEGNTLFNKYWKSMIWGKFKK